MSDGEIKMLATVSEAAFTRLYRELIALPERKRVKRLIVLAQIGQLAEMAAMGHPMLPASDLPPSTFAAASVAAVATTAMPALEPSRDEEHHKPKTDQVAIPVQSAPQESTRLAPQPEAEAQAQAVNSSQLTRLEAGPDNSSQLQSHGGQEIRQVAEQSEEAPLPRRTRRAGHGFTVSL